MAFPPRLGHLATRKVVAAKLVPTYAESHFVDEEEARQRLERALEGSVWEELLDATWSALTSKKTRLDEAGLLEKIAGTLKDRPLRPGKVAKQSPAWSAFLIRLDLEAGTASDMARRVLESEEGRQKAQQGLLEAGAHLAAELTRK